MGQADKIVAIAAMLGSLFLVTSGSGFRGIAMDRRIRMAGIWVLIFLALIAFARFVGPNFAPDR